MRILILSFFYQPEPNDVKAHLLGKELVERGHEVTAITTFPNYPHGEIYPGYKQKWRQWEEKDGVKLLRIPLYPDHSRSSIKRALSYLSFMTTASILGPLLSGRADVMWVYHPPLTTGVAGWWLSMLRRIPFVYEIQDMWPETLTATGMIDNKRALSFLAGVARFIYRRAEAITVISPGFKYNLIEKGVPDEKITVVPNWADETIYKPVPRDPEFGQQHGLESRFNIVFGGNIGPAQALHTVIDAAEILRDMEEIQFVFVGDGLDLERLQGLVVEYNLNNVRFIGRQPAENMPQFYSWAEGLLVHLSDDPLFAITIPSKTLAYLASQRPIICAVPGDGADVIRAAGAGLICPPEDASALAGAIKQLYAMSQTERDALGDAGRQYFMQHFTCKILVDRYEALFEQIVTNTE